MAWTKRTTLGPYQVQGILGKGGMGEIYRALHGPLGRSVAIKRIFDEALTKPELVERFMREGKALAQLSHQGIVTIHDLVQTGQEIYMVLELVDGFDIGQILQNGALPVDVAAIVGHDLADALDHAHYHRIIHRDIKPANCMVSKQGEVKLMDFGIARDVELDGMTGTGILIGTPMYMAPEVITGGRADERSDIYALGALLYQCLSGRRLFEGATRDSIFHHIVDGKYPVLRKVSSDVPWALRRIVGRCLDRRPEKRYPSASALRNALQSFLISHGAPSNHASRLVAFMHSRHLITEREALSCVNLNTLNAQSWIRLRRPVRWWHWATVGILLVAWGLALASLGPESWQTEWVRWMPEQVARARGVAARLTGDSQPTPSPGNPAGSPPASGAAAEQAESTPRPGSSPSPPAGALTTGAPRDPRSPPAAVAPRNP